jgi:hypothetical protein
MSQRKERNRGDGTLRDEGLTRNGWRGAVVELDDDEQIRQNLTMTSRWFSNSVGHASASLGITGTDDNPRPPRSPRWLSSW